MTIRILFSDKTVRVAVELNGGVESLTTELPQREWVELPDKDIKDLYFKYPMALTFQSFKLFIKDIESKVKEKNDGQHTRVDY